MKFGHFEETEKSDEKIDQSKDIENTDNIKDVDTDAENNIDKDNDVEESVSKTDDGEEHKSFSKTWKERIDAMFAKVHPQEDQNEMDDKNGSETLSERRKEFLDTYKVDISPKDQAETAEAYRERNHLDENGNKLAGTESESTDDDDEDITSDITPSHNEREIDDD